MRVLSGIQPSGQLHIGNYFGMMKPMLDYHTRHETFIFIVNYHALTSVDEGETLRKGTIEAALDFLALGLDPDRCIFWVQSDVPEVTELTWILSTVTPMGLLERCHSFKDKTAKGLPATHGLFSYPVLMAADILLYQANIIPVGKDQKQHVEVTRDIAQRFNNQFGETFVLPEPEINENLAVIPGIDGKKMSKSYGNTVEIFTDYKALKKKVMRIVTDSTPVDQPKDPDTCNLFAVFKPFASPEEISELDARYRAPGLGYGEVKKDLVDRIWNYFEPYRKKRDELVNNMDYVYEVLSKGAEKARALASVTLEEVRKRVGLRYR